MIRAPRTAGNSVPPNGNRRAARWYLNFMFCQQAFSHIVIVIRPHDVSRRSRLCLAVVFFSNLSDRGVPLPSSSKVYRGWVRLHARTSANLHARTSAKFYWVKCVQFFIDFATLVVFESLSFRNRAYDSKDSV